MHCNGAVLGQKTGQLPATLGNCYPDKLAMLYLSKCLAVVNAVHYFRVHLATGQFTIKTDHRSEIFFGPSKLSKWKLARWAIALQPLDFVIKHWAGTSNGNADGLSWEEMASNNKGKDDKVISSKEGRSLSDKTTIDFTRTKTGI